MKKVMIFAEGEGESAAAPALVARLFNDLGAWDAVTLADVFRVGQLGSLAKDDYKKWKRMLGAAAKTREFGGVLLLLDGDVKQPGGSWCAVTAAKALVEQAVTQGAGSTYSLAVVFARQEFESWLIAGIESLACERTNDGRLIAPEGILPPEGDLENAPRDAKGWLNELMEGGYKPTRDQVELTRKVDIGSTRIREMRSFRRLESAVNQIVTAVRSGEHVATPRDIQPGPEASPA